MYTFSILSFFETLLFSALSRDLWPSTTNIYVHSLTHSCYQACNLFSLPSFLCFSSFCLHFQLLNSSYIYSNLEFWVFTNNWTMAYCLQRRAETFGRDWIFSWHVLPQHPAVSMWVHRHTSRAEGLLICAIDFLIGSAPCLANENMLCAGNRTFLFEMSACPEMF